MIPNYLVEYLCIAILNPIEDEFMFHLWLFANNNTNIFFIFNTNREENGILLYYGFIKVGGNVFVATFMINNASIYIS